MTATLYLIPLTYSPRCGLSRALRLKWRSKADERVGRVNSPPRNGTRRE